MCLCSEDNDLDDRDDRDEWVETEPDGSNGEDTRESFDDAAGFRDDRGVSLEVLIEGCTGNSAI